MRIPVVDLKPFLYGAPSERLGVAKGFCDALETTGFAVIVGTMSQKRLPVKPTRR